MSVFTNFSSSTKLDSKGRITIPMRIRAKLNLLEGSKLKLLVEENKILLVPIGQGSVKVSTGACEAPSLSSIPGSGLRGDEDG